MATTKKIQNNKDKAKNAKKNIEETWNDKLKKQDDIFWIYCRTKRLNELFREELKKKMQQDQGGFKLNKEIVKQMKNTKSEKNW